MIRIVRIDVSEALWIAEADGDRFSLSEDRKSKNESNPSKVHPSGMGTGVLHVCSP
jgi:hypothetical protein